MLKIQSPSERPTSPHPILNLSFRIFFSAGALFAIVTMLLWMFVYMGKTNMDMSAVNPIYWHAHEMLYGYAMAVIAGFLLTAVKTWTGIMMPYGYRLLGIFACWGVARCLWLLMGLGIGDATILMALAALSDLLFIAWTSAVIIKAVMAVKQYRQMGIISKLVLLTLGNGLVYYGMLSGDIEFMRVGLYLGLFLIIGVVLTIARRVVPFFTERGINMGIKKSTHPANNPVTNAGSNPEINESKFAVKNNKAFDVISLVSFFVFMLADLFYQNKYVITLSALIVAIVNLIRLKGWYHRAIWQLPLLWSLHLALYGCCVSFVLFALQPWLGFSHSLAVHALALSGVGLMTVAMMSRVALGHTGRNIHAPPKAVTIIFVFMILALVFRVIMPMITMEHYVIWLMIAQVCWVASFAVFCITYLPILSKPRLDKLFG